MHGGGLRCGRGESWQPAAKAPSEEGRRGKPAKGGARGRSKAILREVHADSRGERNGSSQSVFSGGSEHRWRLTAARGRTEAAAVHSRGVHEAAPGRLNGRSEEARGKGGVSSASEVERQVGSRGKPRAA
ncbi:hypothetical protein VPH35_014675 [Triticum aestivum]